MGPIDTKLLRAAVVLAEEANFSRAAARLRIGQSGLTKQIFALEELLGFPLFLRQRRRVVPTPAGEIFVAEARLALEHQERAVQLARASLKRTDPVIHLGKSPYTDPYLLTRALSIRFPLYPRLRIILTTKFATELAQDLLNGTLDVAFLTGIPATPRISSVVVSVQSFYVAMLRSDPLARLTSIGSEELARSSSIIFERHVHPILHDELVRVLKPASEPGTVLHHVMTAEDASNLILRGFGIAILTPSGAWRISRDEITSRPLATPGLSLETRLASRADNGQRLVSEFVRRFVQELAPAKDNGQLKLRLAG